MEIISSQVQCISAIFFDFDGLFCDTETSDFEAWVQIYQKFECVLPLDLYAQCVGSGTGFDPALNLMNIATPYYSYDELWAMHEKLHWEMLPNHALPGVVNLIKDALVHGLVLCIVSSSPRLWISRVLKHLSLDTLITHIICRDDVSQVKPFPDLYVMACDRFGLTSSEVIAIEDSPNGAQSALNAGLKCLVVPNEITRTLSFTQHPDIIQLKTLKGMTVKTICAQLNLPLNILNTAHNDIRPQYEY